MQNERKEYTFLWFIENYSYCWHKNGEILNSPELTLDSLEGTVWKLQLYPRGRRIIDRGHISLFLDRNAKDVGPENIRLECELSVLAVDGSSLHSKKGSNTFTKGNGAGWYQFLEIDEVLSTRKSDYIPEDTLCVQCKLWSGEGNNQPVIEISSRTRIGIEEISFLHEIDSFSDMGLQHKKIVQIRSPSKNGFALSSGLYFQCDNGWDWQIMIEIAPSVCDYNFVKCKLSLLDVAGKKIKCGEADNRYNVTRDDINKLPLSLTRRGILDKKNEYLSDDKLSLLCDCVFSCGVEYEKIEKTVYLKHYEVFNNLSTNEDIYTKLLSACPSALDDFQAIYNNQFLTDVELKTKTKSFPAHKNVLCARSSVFKAMLTNDMKEKITDCIQIGDFEDDTLHQLLQFLYSDHLENLEWESAIKLYYAGDKYAIEKLKLLCSSFLMQNISAFTASELLLLADTHNDCHLKKAVEDYILQHEDQVFGSDEWIKLIKTNPVLVSETMCLKYTRKTEILE